MAGVATASLAVDYDRLRVTLGREAGYSTDHTDWTTDEAATIDEAIRRGLALYYHPPILPGHSAAYVWTWLKPIWYVQTVAAQRAYALPDFFERFDGQLFYRSQSQPYSPIKLTSLQYISERQTDGIETGPPCLAALEPIMGEGAGTQRFQLVLYPTPDAAYDLGAIIVAKQTMLNDSNPIPLGGDAHAELLTLACLAKLGEILDNDQGSYMPQFMARLAADISLDARRAGAWHGNMGEANGFGYGPRSGMRDYMYQQLPTYNGVEWTD